MAKKNPQVKADFSEIGVTGLAEFSGSIRDDFLKELRGKEGFKRYNEMRLNSPIISALLLAVENPLRKLAWRFESGEDEDPRVEFLETAKDGMSLSWNDHISEALTMLPFGFSIFEILYKRNETGQIVWRKFAPRGQDTVNSWLFDETGGLTGWEQVCLPNYSPTKIPIEKSLIYHTRSERSNPEGRSILRAAWTSYYFAKHIQQIEAIGIERDIAGLPVITLPPMADTADSDTSDYGKARKLVRNVRNDEQAGIVLPSPDWKLELLSTGGSRQFDTDKIVRRYESRMLMAALAQFLQLGQDSVGSYALSSDQTDFFNLALTSIADNLAETFTKYAVPRLLALNGWDAEGIKLVHGKIGKEDLAGLGTFLTQAGPLLNWTPEDEIWLREVGGLPERDLETLQEAQAVKDAQKAAMAEGLKKMAQQKEQQQEEEEEEEEQAPEKLAADPIDLRKRRKAERIMQDKMEKFFAGQKKRILKAAKEMRG